MASAHLLESFQFTDDETAQEAIASDEIIFEFKVAGVNFLDVLIALGRVSSRPLWARLCGCHHKEQQL